MLPSILVLLVRLSPALSQSQENGPKQYQFHPYHQQLHQSYQQRLHQQQPSENRRHQRTLLPPRNLRNPVIRLKNSDSSRHFASPAYRFQPQSPRPRKPVLAERQQRLLNKNPIQHFRRKPILIRPSSERVQPRIQNKKKPFLAKNSRETRKIANTKLKLGGKNDLKKKYNPDENKKDKKKLYLKEDNIAIESQVVETKVKVPKLTKKPANTKAKYEPKLAKIKKPKKPYPTKRVKPIDTPDKRTYNSAPATPKFIIKQAGPSQQFGWIGHGTYAPLDIPNIFKAAGLNTRWIPEVDELFEAGLTYPAAQAPVAYAQDKLRIEDPVQEAKPAQSYPTKPSPGSSPSYKASNSVPVPSYKSPATASTSVKDAPAVAPAYAGPVSTPAREAPATAPKYKAPSSTSNYEAPAPVPAYKASYEAPAPAPAYKAPVVTSTLEAAAAPAYEAPAPAPSYKAPAPAPTYEAPASAPAYKAPVPTSTYEAPAPAPAYKPAPSTPKQTYKTTQPTQASTSFYGSQSIDLSSSNIVKTNPFLTKSSTARPISIYQASTTYTPRTPPPTISAVTTARPVYSSPIAFTGSPTPPPFTGSPSPASFTGSPTPASFTGSPTPSVYKSSPGFFAQPSYKPSTYFRSTGKPFTAFIGSPEPAPALPVSDIPKSNIASPKFEESKPSIELEEAVKTDIKPPADPEDGEVFYIFYENEQNPLDSVQSGLDLQRYIHEEIEKSKDDSDFSASEVQAEIFEDTPNDIVEPVFSIVEESNKPKQPIYFDVPIKIEENGEGFDPPTEIRTIFVPVENAINIPDTFDISVGTSFGYNKNNKETFPNFSSESDSSYNNPISSYDAPIAPSNKENSVSAKKPAKDSINLNEGPEKKSVRRVRKPKPKSIGKFSYDPVESSLSSIPYGTRLGPRDQYDPLIIKR